jgi:hypothetical protein
MRELARESYELLDAKSWPFEAHNILFCSIISTPHRKSRLIEALTFLPLPQPTFMADHMKHYIFDMKEE